MIRLTIEEDFRKIVHEEVGPDGYLKITRILFPDGNNTDFVIEGYCGENDGEIVWEENFELHCEKSKATAEFLQGMFYHNLQDILE